MQAMFKEIPSYVHDRSDFLEKLEAVETMPDDSYLVHCTKNEAFH